MKPLPLAELRSTAANLGLTAFRLDQANADRAQRIRTLDKINRLRTDRAAIRSCANINGRWVACQVDAGMFGDDYSGMFLPDAVGWIDAVIAEELTELAALREDRPVIGRAA